MTMFGGHGNTKNWRNLVNENSVLTITIDNVEIEPFEIDETGHIIDCDCIEELKHDIDQYRKIDQDNQKRIAKLEAKLNLFMVWCEINGCPIPTDQQLAVLEKSEKTK